MQTTWDSTAPSSSSALLGAASWIGTVMTGSIALAAATIAVAAIGVSMLFGRVPVRRAGEVIIGCFIVFSAEALATGLLGVRATPASDATTEAGPPIAPSYQPNIPVPEQKDPYGGAAAPPPQEADWN